MRKISLNNDKQLAEQIQSSNQQAFEKLFSKYYHDLYRFILFRTRSVEQSKDVVQETFARLWQNRLSIKSDFSIRAYLYKVANNLVLDFIRKQATITNSLPELTEHFNIKSENHDLRLDILAAIENLPDDLRLTFILHRFDGLKYREIAQICEISEKTVEYRMSKTLKILQKQLSK